MNDNPYFAPGVGVLHLQDDEFTIDFTTYAKGISHLAAVKKQKRTAIIVSLVIIGFGSYLIFKNELYVIGFSVIAGGVSAFYSSFASKNKIYKKMYDEIKHENRIYAVRLSDGLFIYSSVRGEYRLPVDEIQKVIILDDVAFIIENSYVMLTVVLRTQKIKEIIDNLKLQTLSQNLEKDPL